MMGYGGDHFALAEAYFGRQKILRKVVGAKLNATVILVYSFLKKKFFFPENCQTDKNRDYVFALTVRFFFLL